MYYWFFVYFYFPPRFSATAKGKLIYEMDTRLSDPEMAEINECTLTPSARLHLKRPLILKSCLLGEKERLI
jgi:hypothetical protein